MAIDVKQILLELCEDPVVLTPDFDLAEGGFFDSLLVIELLDRLADEGVELQPTRMDRTKLHTVAGIEELIAKADAT